MARIGWDLGPTLARWMRRDDPQLHAAWVAQDDGNNGMAQGFHHAILPLGSAHDRRTEIRWGLRDFQLRFGRPATGMWMPETAVDELTLRMAAEEGVRWTILAPWQATEPVRPEVPRRIDLGGLAIGVLFYDAQLSATVSFDPGATTDADRFASSIVGPRLAGAGAAAASNGDGPPADGDGVLVIATDGELYGHHQIFRDLFLDRLLSENDGFTTTTAGAVMDGLDIASLEPVVLRDPSSWSCHHGVMRWCGECPDVADGRWKRPMRQAFDRLAASLDATLEPWFVARGLDLWELRDAYGHVASGFVEPEAWLDIQLARRRGRIEASDERKLLTLLDAMASRLQMFASDGWFWGDPRRLETAQVLRFAAFAARTVDAELGSDLEPELVADLAAVHAPDVPDHAIPQLIELRTGDDLYRAALAAVGQPPPKP